MPREKILESLTRLKTELGDADSQAEAEPILGSIAALEQRLMDPHDPAHFEAVIEELESYILSLESKHPQIAGILRSTVETLNSLGI